MDILEQVITNLTSDEVRRFKILSNRFKADEEKKILVLFDAIRLGGYEAVEDEMITQLYGDLSANSKNSYYRLRNKLLSNLEKSLLFYHFNYKNTIEAHSNLQLAMLLEERGLYKETHYYLKKAEKVAIKNDQFNLLEVIYDEMIRLASKDIEIEVDTILKNRKENFEKLKVIRMTSEVLGVISQQLKKRNFSKTKRNESVLELLEETRTQLETHKEIFHSGTGKILIFKTVSTILQQKSAYAELEQYVKDSFADFETHKIFNKDNHSTRILMRIWRINSLWMLMRTEEAKTEIDALEQDLQLHNRKAFNEYGLYYYSAKSNNQKMRGRLDDAGQTLMEALGLKEITQSGINELILLISQSEQLFCQGLFTLAYDVVQKIRRHPKYDKLGEEVRFYVQVFELVLCLESRNYGLVESLYAKLKSSFRSMMKDENYDKAVKFVEIVLKISEAQSQQKRLNLDSHYKKFIADYPPSDISSNQIIMYELYLQAKAENHSYYKLFCQYVQKAGK